MKLSAVKDNVFQIGNWLYQNKLYHLPFWCGYHFMWWTLRFGDPIGVFLSLALPHVAVKFLFLLIFQMAAAYLNLYYLIPKFLEKGRYIVYITLLLLTTVISAACIVTGYYFGAFLSDKTFVELWSVDPRNYFSLFESGALPSTVAAVTLAMSIKLTKNWLQTRRLHQELEKEKLETELKFLKSQMNPHFLFNTINSIFVLIHKNPLMASESLAKFSDLLRYQLYECNEQQIPIGQELSFLGNFIELQELREDHNLISLNIRIDPCTTRDLVIAPFILIPLIENAFKHVSRKNDGTNWIRVKITFDDLKVNFHIANSRSIMHYSSAEAVRYSGIGLKNVQRRLDLIYPGNYKLSINEGNEEFEVRLQITLRELSGSERILISA